jgi:hypothetical protein
MDVVSELECTKPGNRDEKVDLRSMSRNVYLLAVVTLN